LNESLATVAGSFIFSAEDNPMKLFLIALAIVTIALSDCDTGTRPAENTAGQAQATLIDKHKDALILLLEMTQEELKEKISAKSASIRAKEKKRDKQITINARWRAVNSRSRGEKCASG
jgi:replicative DNA helicase